LLWTLVVFARNRIPTLAAAHDSTRRQLTQVFASIQPAQPTLIYKAERINSAENSQQGPKSEAFLSLLDGHENIEQ
jgi:hypothetical protein